MSKSICNRRATQPPAHFQRNPPGRGQLAVFQGASEAPISELMPTGRGPEGCVENGPAAALLVGYISI